MGTVLEAFKNKGTELTSDKFVKDLEVYDLYFSHLKAQKESINILELGGDQIKQRYTF